MECLGSIFSDISSLNLAKERSDVYRTSVKVFGFMSLKRPQNVIKPLYINWSSLTVSLLTACWVTFILKGWSKYFKRMIKRIFYSFHILSMESMKHLFRKWSIRAWQISLASLSKQVIWRFLVQTIPYFDEYMSNCHYRGLKARLDGSYSHFSNYKLWKLSQLKWEISFFICAFLKQRITENFALECK